MLTSAALAVFGVPASPAAAFDDPAIKLVADQPAAGTPHALDGHVRAITRVGNTMVLGGSFTRARNDDSTTELTRNRVLAFNVDTGQLSTTFNPSPNGPVNMVIPAGDGSSVFVAGSFSSIGGVARSNLARVRVSDGAVLPFNAGTITGQIYELALHNGQLWIGGAFTHVQGKSQPAMATLNPATGAFDPYMSLRIAGTHQGGYTAIQGINITPDGDQLFAVGNFDTLEGVQSRQLLALDLPASGATPGALRTKYYETPCSTLRDAYVRDLDVSPDGSYLVVVTTGGYGGSTAACDTAARFETDASGANVQPSWISSTGGDTLHSVKITESVVYLGGHQRWHNNAFAPAQATQGAVGRQGISAVDPANGLPLSWNPGRTRGVGVSDFFIDDRGLWVGSDTDRIGGRNYRGRVALLPHAGGSTYPAVRTPGLPNNIHVGGLIPPRSGAQTTLNARSYQAGTFGTSTAVPAGGINWGEVRGAFMLNGQLYLATSDGQFTRRSFDGTTYGAPVPVDTADEIVPLTNWTADLRNASSMFYDSGRIYFTNTGSNTLYYRYFSPESDVVGVIRYVAASNPPGVAFNNVRGAFTDGDDIYFATLAGGLWRMEWAEGDQSDRPIASTSTQVSGPGVDGLHWAARTLFLFQNQNGSNPAMPTAAGFEKTCSSVDCEFDAGISSSPDSDPITGYAWAFGDGSTATGKTASHSYAASGAYDVQLTVTTQSGETATKTQRVTVTETNRAPVAAVQATCEERTCSFDASGSTDPDGDPLTYSWTFGDGTTGTGAKVNHAYPSDGTRTATVTVSDGARTHQASTEVNPTLARLDHVAAASTAGNRSTHSVDVPGAVRAGDTMLLFLTTNSTGTTIDNAVPGWALVREHNGDGVRGRVWQRTATAADAGSTVSVNTSGFAKSVAALSAYRSTTGSAVVAASATGLDTTGTQHTAPSVAVSGAKSWLVNFWSEKTSIEQAWTLPGGVSPRTTSTATGTGKVSGALGDSNGPVPGGTAGGRTATTSNPVSRALMFSVVLAPQ